MGLRDEFRPPRRARRGDEDGGVVGPGPRAVGRVGVTGPEETVDLAVPDDEPGSGLADQPGQLRLGRGRVGGHQDGAEAHEPEPGEEMAGGVAQGGEDQVAPADTEVGQPGGHGADPAPGLLVGERGVLVEQPRALRGRLDGAGQEVGDGAFHRGSGG